MTLKDIVLLVVIWGFTGCAEISPDKLKTITKIGVMSLHGNNIEVLERGLTIFGNEDYINDITDWDIDKNIQNEIMKNFSNPQLTIVPIHVSSDEIDLYLNKDDKYSDFDFYKRYMIQSNVDYLVVMIKRGFTHESTIPISGIGIIKGKAFGSENTTTVFRMVLVGYELINKELDMMHMHFINQSSKIDDNLWKNTKKPISRENLMKLKIQVQETLGEIIQDKMRTIGYKK